MSLTIKLEDVSWERNKQPILKDINWQVENGEHWAILGLNGSGKTTLLNMICGYLWPTSGKVTVFDHPYGSVDLREVRKEIGWVSSSFQERLRADDYAQEIVISGKHASVGIYEDITDDDLMKAQKLMKQLSCEHLYNRIYQSCSQGEKQKLLIARALMASPKLLILDEPTTGLDFLARESLLKSIETLANSENAPTILYVTHHVEEILPIFSKTLLLKHGEIFAGGETEEIMNSGTLRDFYQTNIEIQWHNSRPWMTVC